LIILRGSPLRTLRISNHRISASSCRPSPDM
jgi:hypothetical protein